MGSLHAIVIGGTGMVGGFLMRELCLQSRYSRVTQIVRRSVPSPNPKVTVHLADFDRDEWEFPADKADVLFISLGTTMAKAGSESAFRRIDLELPLAAARKARLAGVHTVVVVSAVGADSGSRLFYNRVKGELEDALRQLAFERLVIFRPSLLLGHRAESRPAERMAGILVGFLHRILPGGLGRYSGMPADKLALAMTEAPFRLPLGISICHFRETFGLIRQNHDANG